MKKFPAILLSVLMFISLFASCGQKNGETDGTTPADEPSRQEQEEDLSAYEYGEIDYAADITGIDMSLVEKKVGEIDRETLEKAIQEVCFAYYWKNPYTEYDLGTLSYDSKSGKRRTSAQSPEDTDWDTHWYGQCSEYAYQVYLELCGYEFFGDRIYSVNGPAKILDSTWVASSRTLGYDEEKVSDFILHEAKAGDIFYGGGFTVTGHIIMFVGDTDGDGISECLHCWPYKGGSMNSAEAIENEGNQQWEPEGAIVWETSKQLLLGIDTKDLPNWSVFSERNDQHWQIYRPFEQPEINDCHLTPDTVTRLTFNGISVSKTPNQSVHQSIVKDQDVGITEVITNNSKAPYENLNVVEYVPDYTVLKETDDNCTVDGRKLKWTVNVPAGESVTLSYTVTNKLGAGKVLTVPAGLVAGLQTRTFDLQVAKSELTDEQIQTLKTIAESKKFPKGVSFAGCTELDYVTMFYQEVLGMDVELPATMNELLSALFYEGKAVNKDCMMDKMLYKKEDVTGFEKLNQMIVLNQIGGLSYCPGEFTGSANYKLDRIIDFQEGYYEPGDIFLSMGGNGSRRSLGSPSDLEIYIYLGDGKVAAKVRTVFGVADYEDTVDKLFKQNFIIQLRPRLAY